MVLANPHFQKLPSQYLFPRIAKEAALLKEKKPESRIINLGTGDIKEPLVPSIVTALCDAALEMGETKSFKGYGPSQGYFFLQELIALHDYPFLHIHPDEIFISDGAKCDSANIQDILDPKSLVALADPSYPVYVDASLMTGKKIVFLPCTEENGFCPKPPNRHVDLIYLASPNNPTGVAMTKEALEPWIYYAKRESAILIFDAAYEAFITGSCPHSIYEIEGAREVAIEIRSYSKSAGFTGLRCSYMVIPKTLILPLHPLWMRRTDTKFNGVSYIIQKAAAATYSEQGKKELSAQINRYQANTATFRTYLNQLGLTTFGGIDAPYIWCKTPPNFSSWQFFELLLHQAHILTTPGAGFGPCGEGYVRFFAIEEPSEAMKRLSALSLRT